MGIKKIAAVVASAAAVAAIGIGATRSRLGFNKTSDEEAREDESTRDNPPPM